MKKLLFLVVTLLAFIPLAYGQRTTMSFNNDIHQYESSIVRIVTQNDDGSGQGLQSDLVNLDNGDKFYDMSWSTGTGFLINRDGYIVTNNHVVAVTPESRDPQKFIMVVETVGKHRYAHRATVIWQSPENDVAVIQCTHMQGTPIPLDLSAPEKGEPVETMGYPGQQDEVAINIGDLTRIESQIKERIAGNLAKDQLTEDQKQDPRINALNKDEIDAVNQQAENMASVVAKNYNFNACLSAIGKEINSTWNQKDYWDITDVFEQDNTWDDFFEYTESDGKIENLSVGSSYTGEGHVDVPLISHNLDIKHGNSGGPLLSDRGGVMGIVGRGDVDGDSEKRFDATRVDQLFTWLNGDSSRHYEKLFYIPRRTMIMVCLGLLVVAFGFVYISLNSPRPALAQAGGGAGSAGDYGVTPPKNGPAKGGERTIVPGKSGSGWVLAGRAGGRNLNVEFNEGLFTRNGGRLIIGRSPELSHLVLETDDVSRQHAQIRKEGGSFFIADRNSSNRTAVNGQFTGAPFAEVSLREGDTLTFGEAKVEFRRA